MIRSNILTLTNRSQNQISIPSCPRISLKMRLNPSKNHSPYQRSSIYRNDHKKNKSNLHKLHQREKNIIEISRDLKILDHTTKNENYFLNF